MADEASPTKKHAITPNEDRRRTHMTVTVHPLTIQRIDELGRRFETTRGRVVDRLVEVLSRSYSTGKVHCIHGQVCQLGRADLPDIF